MAILTIVLGLGLSGLGLYAFFGIPVAEGSSQSPTALIPLFFGLPILVLGLLALRGGRRAFWSILIADVLCTLGIIGTFSALPKLYNMIAEGAVVDRPEAVIIQSIMAGACLLYLIIALFFLRGHFAKRNQES